MTIQSAHSIGAIPARNLVHLASSYQSDIHLRLGERRINAKSIIGILAATITPQSTVTLEAEGNDEKEAVQALANFISHETFF